MPLLPVDQNTEAWLAVRTGRITASNAAACLGLNPWDSRQKGYRLALGIEPQRDNPAMAWGRAHEDEARMEYELETGRLVVPTGFWVHPHLDWLGASPDRLVGTDGLLEVKCPTKPAAGVPLHHRIQCLVQLACTERSWCDYYAWHPDGTFLKRIYPAGIQGLLWRLTQFYESYVLPNVPPPRRSRK